MSTLSEHQGNGNHAETSLQREDTKEPTDAVLWDLDVLPSPFDRFIFQYIWVILIGNFFLNELLAIPYVLLLGIRSFPVGEFLLDSGLNVFITAAFLSVLWRFNVWRVRTPKTLRSLVEKKNIAARDGDTTTSYLHFLEGYHEALASPKRYFLSGFLMILASIDFASTVPDLISVAHPNSFVTLLKVIEELLTGLVFLGGVYCIGIVTWTVYISGWYVRKLVRVFALRIQPFHSDKCGGLKGLGNFCFGLVSPLLIGSGLTIGYLVLLLIGERGNQGGQLALTVGAALLVLLFYALPATIFVLLLPLRDIHTKMVSTGEADEDLYNAHIEALREEIQALLDTNRVEEAKAVQEKKALVETLHLPYPTWPFLFRSKVLSTVLGVSGSLLIGMMTAALQQYFLPAILPLLFHTP
jgi:hypothetical protein